MRLRTPIILVAVLAFCAAGAAVTFQGTDPNEKLLAEARALMASREFAKASALLQGVEGTPRSSRVALQASLLRSKAELLAGNAETAANQAREIIAALKDPEAPGVGRAEAVLADALEAMGRDLEAAKVYAAAATRALGETPKTRLASGYLTLAERLAQPEKSQDLLGRKRKADPAGAAQMQLLALGILNDGKPLARITLPRARLLIEASKTSPTRPQRRGPGRSRKVRSDGRWLQSAVAELSELLKPERADTANSKPSSLRPKLTVAERAEALLLKGRALNLLGQSSKAITEWRQLIAEADFAETPFQAEGRRALGGALVARKTPSDIAEGIDVWNDFLRIHPSHPQAAATRDAIADAAFSAADYGRAITAYNEVLGQEGASRDSKAKAAYRIGLSERAQGHFGAARKELLAYLALFPDHASVPNAQTLLPNLYLEHAKALRKEKKDLEAIEQLRLFVREHPLASKASQVAVEIGNRLLEMDEVQKAQAAYTAARDRYRQHDPNYAARAALALGRLHENKRGDLETAIRLYNQLIKDFGSTSAANQARAEIAKMQQIELSLNVPRLFTSQEQPELNLRTRNLEKATVRLYALEAIDVFERRRQLEAAADIEVALVKADLTTEWKPKAYKRYQRFEHQLPVSADGGKKLEPGAYLVAVESGDRRVVVPVLISDLRVVLKQSPSQVLAWVTHAVTGEPVQGAKVLVRGKNLSEEKTTNADGVAQWDFEKSQGNCRVLATWNGHVAQGLTLKTNRKAKKELSPRAAFTFDRPLYRPGEKVQWRAVIREVKDGSFVTPKSKALNASLRDPRGRVIQEQKAKFEGFGVVHGSFVLPNEAAIGDYKVELRYAQRVFTDALVVSAFTKPEFEVQVNAEKRVVRPGEELDFTTDVMSFFGGPVRDAQFRWRIWSKPHTIDRSQYENHAWYLRAIAEKRQTRSRKGWKFLAEGQGQVNEKGRGRFSLIAPEGQAVYMAEVSVRNLAGEWVQGVGQAWVGTTDRFAVVLAEQQAVRAGDSVEVRVVTADLGHAVIGTLGSLEAIRLRRVDAGRVEQEILKTLNVDTGMDGEARLKVPLASAGDWILRFRGLDGNDKPVVSEVRVSATGERPDLKTEARLRFERASYRGGEQARLHLSLPAANRPALLTFEGSRVLRYKVVRPSELSTVLTPKLDADFAPNITAAIAFPHEHRLLEDQDEVVVLRWLEVSVKPSLSVAKPRDTVDVLVKTKDQLGNPVASSVAMRVVDQALSGMGGKEGSDPRLVFNLERRQHLVSTGSSYAFKIEAQARMLDAALQELTKERRLREVLKSLPSEEPVVRDTEMMDHNEADNDEEWEESKGEEDQLSDKPFGGGTTNDSIGVGGGAGGSFGSRRGGRSRKKIAQKPMAPKRKQAALSRSVPRASLRPESQGAHNFLGRAAAIQDPNQAPRLMKRTRFADVAAWYPAVVTNAKGETVLRVELPDNLTTWAITGDAAGRGQSIGRGKSRIAVRQPVRVSVARPAFLGSKDVVQISALATNATKEKREFSMQLNPSSGPLNAEGADEWSFELEAFDTLSKNLQLQAGGAGTGVLSAKLQSRSGDLVGDETEVLLPVVAFGTPWQWVRYLELNDRAQVSLEIPSDLIAGSEDLRVVVESGVGGEVLTGLRFLAGYPYGCLEQTLNRFIPAMLLAEAKRQAGSPLPFSRTKLAQSVHQGLVQLAAYQRSDGTFAYWPKANGKANAHVTALALQTMVRARGLGYEVSGPVIQLAVRGAERLLRQRGVNDDARAALVLALSRAGSRPVSALNTLFRKRASLGTASLGRLVLACQRMNQSAISTSLMAELQGRNPLKAGKLQCLVGTRDSWMQSSLEAASLSLLAALSTQDPRLPTEALVSAVKAGVRRRAGGTKAVALGLEALIAWERQLLDTVVRSKLELLANGKTVAQGTIDAEHPRCVLTIPANSVNSAGTAQRFEVRSDGGATLNCRFVLRALRQSEAVSADGSILEVTRRVTKFVEPGKKKSAWEPGYDIVRAESRPKRQPIPGLSEVVEGERVTIELLIKTRKTVRHLAIEDPFFACLQPMDFGVTGSVDHSERRADRMVFFKDSLSAGSTLRISYPAYAVYSGTFFAMPARAECMYAEDKFGASSSDKLHVVPDVKMLARSKPAPLTPDERFSLGTSLFESERFGEALEALASLPEQWDLKDSVLDQSWKMVLVSYLRTDRHSKAIQAFETLRMRSPGKGGVSLTIQDRERLGRAYLSVKDAAAARGAFQMVWLSQFGAEEGLAHAMESLGDRHAALRWLQTQSLRYPSLGAIATFESSASATWMGLSDESLDAETASLLSPTKRAEWARALNADLSVMAWHPGSGLAESAGRHRIEVLAKLGFQGALLSESQQWAKRFPKSTYADTAELYSARAAFALGRYKVAKVAATKVWEQRWTTGPRSSGRSQWRWQAGWLLGRLAHVDGDLQAAVNWYDKVRRKVPGAQQSWLFFSNQELSVHSVVRAAPNSKAVLPVTIKNCAEVKVLAYPVDLGVLFALAKGFDGLKTADLSGIRPAKEFTVKPTVAPYTRAETKIDLGTLSNGAWLLVVRSGDQARTSLLLVSEAKMTVQRIDQSFRIYLVDAEGRPVSKANVKLAGNGRIFDSGQTDERGMLHVKSWVPGTVTAIAERGDIVAITVVE